MMVKLNDTSSVTATISWGAAKMKQSITAEGKAILKPVVDKWSAILKNDEGSPLKQMVALQNAALEILK
jgi:hypothetical protein